jgi:GNAT superfamily N-acetyltransferase
MPMPGRKGGGSPTRCRSTSPSPRPRTSQSRSTKAGEVVAVAALFPPGAPGRSVAGPGEAEFARLAVADRARGRGVGKALVLGATERARGLGAERVALWSRPNQTGAHVLYESLGWRRVPERDEDDRDGRRRVFVLDL